MSAYKNFSRIISCLATYFLEVGAHFSLKVTIKASLRGEKILKILIFRLLFQKQKRRSANKEIDVSAIGFASLYLVQLHIICKWVHPFQ